MTSDYKTIATHLWSIFRHPMLLAVLVFLVAPIFCIFVFEAVSNKISEIRDVIRAHVSVLQKERRFTIIAINDIYRLSGVKDETVGGLTRVRTLRKNIELESPNTILLHAGDFLSPSLISDRTDGASMIDVMNRLDGNSGPGIDERMFVTLGNHEFDKSRCADANPPLSARVSESRFRYLLRAPRKIACPSAPCESAALTA